MTTDPRRLGYMRQALELAARGLGRTSPNPAVGAVVVAAGEVVGEGFHRAAGQPHAEVLALREAGERAAGADLYVSLEPCSTSGRTPPCTEAIIAAGITRVIYACRDCDPSNAGRADGVLNAAGIETVCGPLEQEARELNEAYFKHKVTGRPCVTVKLACTLDGKIATRSGESKWITGEKARAFVHVLRDRSDAVMVGYRTVLADDPALSTRLDKPDARDALRVVVDSTADTPPGAKGGAAPSSAPCISAGAAREMDRDYAGERAGELEEAGAELLELPERRERPGGMDLRKLRGQLGARDIMSVLGEGGGRLVGGLLRQNLVDKFLLFYAPKIIGDQNAISAVIGLDIENMSGARTVRIERVEQIGEDILVTAYPCSPD